MFDTLAARLGQAVDSLRGRGRLSEDNIADTLRLVRMALLEADVAVAVVKAFIDAARARAIGAEVTRSLTPGQAVIRIIHEELTRVMGEPGRGLNLRLSDSRMSAGMSSFGSSVPSCKSRSSDSLCASSVRPRVTRVLGFAARNIATGVPRLSRSAR